MLPAGQLAERSRPDRVGARGGAARAAAPEALDALGVQDRPHRLGRDRRALGARSAAAISVTERSSARSLSTRSRIVCGLARSLGPGLGGTEELGAPGAQLGGQLVHRRRRVAEALGHLGRGHPVDEVGPQRLVAALGGHRRLDEVLGPRPHDCR